MTTTTEQTTEATEPIEPTTETAETTEVETPNHEAAGYRRKLRDAEQERDGLAGQLDAMRRAAAEQLASRVLAKPEALWAAGTQVASLLAEDGTVDATKVTAAATAAQESLGLARPKPGNYAAREGSNPQAPSGAPRFEDALRQQ